MEVAVLMLPWAVARVQERMEEVKMEALLIALSWRLFELKSLFLEKFFLLESEKKKERMKKWRLCVEEKNEE